MLINCGQEDGLIMAFGEEYLNNLVALGNPTHTRLHQLLGQRARYAAGAPSHQFLRFFLFRRTGDARRRENCGWDQDWARRCCMMLSSSWNWNLDTKTLHDWTYCYKEHMMYSSKNWNPVLHTFPMANSYQKHPFTFHSESMTFYHERTIHLTDSSLTLKSWTSNWPLVPCHR